MTNDLEGKTIVFQSNGDYSQRPLLLERKNSKIVENSQDARKVLATKPSGVRGERDTSMTDMEMVEMANIRGIFFPWAPAYKLWWHVTAMGAIFTVFFAPFQIAFEDEPGTFMDVSGTIELFLNSLFTVDIFVNFNLAFYKDELIVFERREIFWEYFGCMFWWDFIGVFPFETVCLLGAGKLGESSRNALLFSLLRMLRFVR